MSSKAKNGGSNKKGPAPKASGLKEPYQRKKTSSDKKGDIKKRALARLKDKGYLKPMAEEPAKAKVSKASKVSQQRKECRDKGKVYDRQTDKCRESKVPAKGTSKASKVRACRKEGKVYDAKTEKCRASKVQPKKTEEQKKTDLRKQIKEHNNKACLKIPPDASLKELETLYSTRPVIAKRPDRSKRKVKTTPDLSTVMLSRDSAPSNVPKGSSNAPKKRITPQAMTSRPTSSNISDAHAPKKRITPQAMTSRPTSSNIRDTPRELSPAERVGQQMLDIAEQMEKLAKATSGREEELIEDLRKDFQHHIPDYQIRLDWEEANNVINELRGMEDDDAADRFFKQEVKKKKYNMNKAFQKLKELSKSLIKDPKAIKVGGMQTKKLVEYIKNVVLAFDEEGIREDNDFRAAIASGNEAIKAPPTKTERQAAFERWLGTIGATKEQIGSLDVENLVEEYDT